MVPSFEVRTLSGKTAFIDGDGIPDVAALRDRIASLEGVPADALRLTSNAQELHAGKQLPHGTSVTVLLRLLGGKGGFGAMLRTAGARGVKTTNFDACRDLNGRRLRHVNAEQRLREWDQQAEERKLKKQQEDAKHAKPTGPQIARFDDEEYDEMLEGARSRVNDALAAGMRVSSSEGGGSSGTEPEAPDAHIASGASDPTLLPTASSTRTSTSNGKRKVEGPAAPDALGSAPKAAKLNAAFDPLLATLGDEEDSSEGEGEEHA